MTGVADSANVASAGEPLNRDGSAIWTLESVMSLFDLSFADLIFRAQQVYRKHFDANSVQLSTLLSVKTGGCPEDCGYCPQATRFHTGVENEKLMSTGEVVSLARAAKERGGNTILHGSGLAQSETARSRESFGDGARGEIPRT